MIIHEATTRADSNQMQKGGTRGAGRKLDMAKGAQVALHALASVVGFCWTLAQQVQQLGAPH